MTSAYPSVTKAGLKFFMHKLEEIFPRSTAYSHIRVTRIKLAEGTNCMIINAVTRQNPTLLIVFERLGDFGERGPVSNPT